MDAPLITSAEVRRIARLARLALTDDEIARLTSDLLRILDYVSRLRGLALPDGVDESGGAAEGLRSDEPRAGLSEDDALGAAPAVERNHFIVPRVVGE